MKKDLILRSGAVSLGLMFGGLAATSLAASETTSASDLDPFSFSVEQLMSVEVTSVSKKKQRVSETAAAIYVITQDDILQSGARNIPEALRMAPGVQVAQIDANKWAVTIRGFNGQFANKLLVMIDGRTIYNPSFAGVYWDTPDTLMSDIDRIEVIRGSGGTIWGSNAVNGVINVITKATSETQGALVTASTGTHENKLTGRLGGTIGDDADYRLFAKYTDQNGNQDVVGNDVNDDWKQGRIGGRVDWRTSDYDAFTFSGEAYAGESGETLQLTSLNPVMSERVDTEQDVEGIYARGRWDHAYDSGNQSMIQSYIDYSDRDGLLYGATLLTLEIEGQQRFSSLDGHDIVMGAQFRHNDFESENSQWISLSDNKVKKSLYSLYIQDEIELVEDKLSVTIGARVEHNDQSPNGLDWMPSIRGTWQINPANSLWAAATRALRTPSYFETDGMVTGSLPNVIGEIPAIPFPLIVQLSGNPNQTSEELTSYELGYRTQPTDSLNFDFTLYYNDYEDLRSLDLGTPTCQPTGLDLPACLFDVNTQYIMIPGSFANNETGDAYGAELSFDWLINSKWRLFGTYSYLHLVLQESNEPDRTSAEDPEHMLNLQSQMKVRENIDFDIWLRYTDELDSFTIDDYWALDSRVAWRPRPDIELALIGKNLLQSSHLEFGSELETSPLIEIERSAIAELRWSF